jgi:hypothetical protein
MCRMLLYYLICSVLLLLLVSSSCGPRNAHVIFPPHWPIAQITLPSQATRSRIGTQLQGLALKEYTSYGEYYIDGQATTEGTLYIVGFKYSKSYNSLIKFIDDELQQLGYSVEYEVPGTSKNYISRDLLYKVQLAINSSDKDSWYLSIITTHHK